MSVTAEWITKAMCAATVGTEHECNTVWRTSVQSTDVQEHRLVHSKRGNCSSTKLLPDTKWLMLIKEPTFPCWVFKAKMVIENNCPAEVTNLNFTHLFKKKN